ncbi:MAG: hypothetical protein ACYC3X_11500 [Pirellulaceae bacterium]
MLAGILFLSLTGVAVPLAAADKEPFLRVTDPHTGWRTSVRCAADTSRVEFLRAGQTLGAVTLRVRTLGEPGVKSGEARMMRNCVPAFVRTATPCSGRSV